MAQERETSWRTMTDAMRQGGPKDHEGQLVENTGREGQKDTALDQDRTNDRPVGGDREGHGKGDQRVSLQEQLKALVDKARGVEKGPPTAKEKVQKAVDKVAEKTRSRGMELGR